MYVHDFFIYEPYQCSASTDVGLESGENLAAFVYRNEELTGIETVFSNTATILTELYSKEIESVFRFKSFHICRD